MSPSLSIRQSNVEDLRKLAKQFDINMTRQDKENNRRAQKEEINSISYKVMGKREQKDQHLSKSHQNN